MLYHDQFYMGMEKWHTQNEPLTNPLSMGPISGASSWNGIQAPCSDDTQSVRPLSCRAEHVTLKHVAHHTRDV